MSCPYHKQVSAFVLEELTKEKKEAFKHHLETCPACSRAVRELNQVSEVLRRREKPGLPPGLVRQSRRAVHTIRPAWEIRRPDRSFLPWRLPAPIWQGGLALIIFLGGLGAGKLIFGGFSSRPVVFLFRSAPDVTRVNQYLLGVETLFLNLTNYEGDAPMPKTLDLEKIRSTLQKTRKFKAGIKNDNPALADLLDEIERALDDILRMAEFGEDILKQEIQDSIQERELLPKIRNQIS